MMPHDPERPLDRPVASCARAAAKEELIPARHQHTGIISSQGTNPQALRSANAASPSSPRDFP
jgi:hypothetical protein